jgi:quinol monooxygenase YgiN
VNRKGGTALSFLTVEFVPRPEKHREFLLTIQPLVELTREEQGCTTVRLFHDTQDQVVYLLVGDWESPGHVDRYVQSDLFQVLLGTSSLLRERPKIRVDGIPRASASTNETVRARARQGTPTEQPGP